MGFRYLGENKRYMELGRYELSVEETRLGAHVVTLWIDSGVIYDVRLATQESMDEACAAALPIALGWLAMEASEVSEATRACEAALGIVREEE